jgi:PAS domain S-box-containing protein
MHFPPTSRPEGPPSPAREVRLWLKLTIVLLATTVMEVVIRLAQLRPGQWSVDLLAFFLPIALAVFLSLTIAKKEGHFHSSLEAEQSERNNVQALYQEEAAARKRLEFALERSQELARAAIESAHIGVWDHDLATGKEVWSDIRKELFGFPTTWEPDVNAVFNAIHPDDRERVRKVVTDAAIRRQDYCIEYRVVWPDGSVHWLWGKGRAISDAAGNAVRAAGVTMNIDDRKQTEELARSKSALLEAQMNSTLDGILVVDSEGRVILRNKRFLEIWQTPPALAEQDNDDLILQHACSATKNPEQFLERVRYLYDHPSVTSRDEVDVKDGRVLDRYSAPVVGEDGQYYGRIWIFRDISERRRNEDTLRQLSLAVEQSPVSVVITDPENKISYVNPKFTELTGYEAEEVLGKDPSVLNSGLTPPEAYGSLWSTLKQGREWRGEFCNKKKGGEIFWESATIRPITNEQGAVVHYLAVKEDITERKRSEEEVRASRQMLQSILDAIPQRVFWKDKNCVYLGCNRPFAADAGLDSPAAIVGKNDFELSWADVAGRYRADDQQVMEQRTARLNFQERQTRPGGSELWLQTNKIPLLDLYGQVTGVLGTYEDITEQKRAEEELRLMQFSLEHASDAVYWINSQGRIVYVNQAACRSLGRSREEFLSMSIPDIDPQFSKEQWPAAWEETKKRGSMTFETQHKTKRGEFLPVEITANYLEFGGKEYSFAFARDISARRELETQLRQAQKLEAIGQLAAGIAHEINTPAQYVGDNTSFLKEAWASMVPLFAAMRQLRTAAGDGGSCQAMLEEFDRRWETADIDYMEGEIPKAIDQSLEGVQRVTRIVRAMKEFSHPGSEEKQAVDINKAVETTVTVARNEWKYVAEVETLLEPGLPAIPCHAAEFNQVILNLLVNSAHAIEQAVGDGSKGKGKITIRTRRDKDGIELAISDTGAGIPVEAQPRMFEPFFTTKPVGKGTGQGLALAHNTIVKRHGGRIWFESTPGTGTTFFIRIPFPAAAMEASC